MTLSLEEKIGQMLAVGFHGLEPPDYILDWLAAGRIGGIILFARNVASPSQLAELTQACHEAARHPLLVAIDQEGGIVARLREGFTESPGALALGVADSESLAEEVSRVLGAELRALGINWNLAPVVDITHDISNPSVGARSLGSDKARVSKLAVAQVLGFQKAGVAATAKHFPGLGNTPVDSHDEMPVIDRNVDYLWEHDLVPFRATVSAGVATVMISHVKFPSIDGDHPSTLSRHVITELLRDAIGFAGLVCTDCMEMHAISDHYLPGESAVLAALAGDDLIFFSHSFTSTHETHSTAYDDLVRAAQNGRIPIERIDEAVTRVLDLKQRYGIVGRLRSDLVGHPDHRQIMMQAARAGVVLLRGNDSLPLKPGTGMRIGAIEFASLQESGIVEQGGLTGLGKLLRRVAPFVESVALRSVGPSPESLGRARKLAQESDLLILATRNAHIVQSQLEMAGEFMGAARRVVLLCLRNPYDASVLPSAGTVICTCGDSSPSLQAAVEVLLGRLTPSGVLPVPLRNET